MKEKYARLIEHLRTISDLRFAGAVLDWDRSTFMPPKGNDARSRQVALLTELAHQRLSERAHGELLAELHEASGLTPEQRAVVREARRDYDRATRLPSALVREISDTCGKAHLRWVEAREKSQFRIFAPILKQIIQLKRQEAECLGYAGGVAYDALIDAFEPGATVASLDPVIRRTREITVNAVRAIASSRRKPKLQILRRRYPIESQEKLGTQIIAKMGFDLDAGRLDRSIHPFSTNFDVQDVRITTRYDERYFNDAVFSTIHEAGHGLYEQGFRKEFAGTPLAEAISMGIHESQSRIWENQIGRSMPFWRYFFPKARKLFPEALGKVSLEDFHFAVNAVQPSFIRVDADEVTYNLHIIIRYELEQALISGDLSSDDLPRQWNAKMKEYLGIQPKRDSQGVLQDVHWSAGLFGYFPSYLLGNLYSAQWMHTLKREVRGIDAKVARGDLLAVKSWLNRKIHQPGRFFRAAELVREVSGEPLNPEYLDQYFKAKYQPLYGVKWE